MATRNRSIALRVIVPAAILLALLVCAATTCAQDGADASGPSDYQAVAALYGLDPSLLHAIASVESNGNAFAVSPKGAVGLMQLMPDTAREFHVRDRFDPIDNLLGAARFLVWLHRWAVEQRDFGAYLPEIIAAYNAGPQAVSRYKGIPPYPETRRYVRRVLLAYLLRGPRDGGLAIRGGGSVEPNLCRNNCDRHWLSQLERIRTLRSRTHAQ